MKVGWRNIVKQVFFNIKDMVHPIDCKMRRWVLFCRVCITCITYAYQLGFCCFGYHHHPPYQIVHIVTHVISTPNWHSWQKLMFLPLHGIFHYSFKGVLYNFISALLNIVYISNMYSSLGFSSAAETPRQLVLAVNAHMHWDPEFR